MGPLRETILIICAAGGVIVASTGCVRSRTWRLGGAPPPASHRAEADGETNVPVGSWGAPHETHGHSAPTSTPVRPALPDQLSFLFITIDTLRPDLGYTGYERPVSPNIDELASRSIIYERAYSISTYTAYAVPPMMASRYPSEMPRNDRHEARYFPKNVMLAERLHDAGYHTAGAASHFLFSRELGWVDGLEKFVMTGAEGNTSSGSGIDYRHTSRPLADSAIRFLENPTIVSGKFFIWVHFLDPHKKYLEHPGFSNFGKDPRALYDGEIAFTDFHIGRVLRALAASPAADRTVVILTGDHGEAFGEHGFFYHGRHIWDEVVRIPFLIYVPGAEPRTIARRMSTVDIAPTILDLAGLPADKEARGESLAPEIFGGELAPRPILIDQPRNPNYPPKRGFIEGPYKLHHAIDTDTYRLFDLDLDPGETNDLAESQPKVLANVQHSYAEFVSRIVEFTPKRTIPYPKDNP